MRNNRNLLHLLVAGAVGAWALNIALISALFTSTPAASDAGPRRGDPLSKSMDFADSALHCKPVVAPFKYYGDFEAPFRLGSEAFAPSGNKKKASSPILPISLVLKGVLLKEQPLAILEDEKGATFICGIGEKIQDYVVESIGPSSIQLRGRQGAYTLSVKE